MEFFILHFSTLHLPLFTRRVSVMTGFGAADPSGEDSLARGGSLKNAPRRVLGARLHRPRPLYKGRITMTVSFILHDL
jgi:hypothetical protein